MANSIDHQSSDAEVIWSSEDIKTRYRLKKREQFLRGFLFAIRHLKFASQIR